MTLGPGLHRNVSKADYLADIISPAPSLSASTAKLLTARSPAHAWSAHPMGGRQRGAPTDAMNNGTLIDSLLLGGDSELASLPEMLPNSKGVLVPTNDKYMLESAKAWKEEQIAAGRLPVKADELHGATVAAERISQNLARDGATLDGENQVTLLWQEANGAWCKGRMDHWSESRLTIYDLKVVDCAHPKTVARKMVDYGWAIQAAAYVRGVETLRPEWAGRVRFVLLAAESEPPYEVLVRPLAGSMRALGEWHWMRAVEVWGACLETRKWPGYAGMEAGIEAPPYALAEMEEGLAGGSDGISF